MEPKLGQHLREAGYETLFYLGGFLAWSLHPTPRNLNDMIRWFEEKKSRREFLRRLEERGLIEIGTRKGQWVALLTESGQAAFAGGRHPKTAWGRPWDKQWRLLTFDLPRKDNRARMKLRHWMCQNYLGRLQGSVWISPDPMPALGQLMDKNGIDPAGVMIFEGTPAGNNRSRDIAASAWDFETVGAAYRDYIRFAERTLRNLRKSTPSQARLQGILRENRKQWWEAVRIDPLLPKALHPKEYKGPKAWKLHGELLKKLGQDLTP